MWLALFSITYALAASNPLEGEAELLWAQGKSAYESGQTKEAVRTLERLIKKYPASNGFLEAHDLLARSYYKTGEYKKALAATKYYTEAQSVFTDRGFRSRIFLSDVYLALGQKEKAYAQSLECVRAGQSPKGELQPRHLFLSRAQEAKTLLAQKKLNEVDSILKTLSPPSDGSISPAEILAVELVKAQYQTARCSLYATDRILAESEWKLQMETKANCLQDLAVKIQTHWNTSSNSDSASQALTHLETLSQSFYQSCGNPPQPMAKMSARQKQQSAAELKLWMKPICRDKLSKLLEVLNSWPPPSAKGMVDRLNATRRSLEGLKQKLHS